MSAPRVLGWLLGLRLVGVVDQIDAGWAAVEWQGTAYGHVRVELLPEGTHEGDAIVLRRRRRGALIHLPREIAPPDGPAVRASLSPGRTRPRSSKP